MQDTPVPHDMPAAVARVEGFFTALSPQDVDQLRVGQMAEVRFTAFRQRDMPRIEGKLATLSAGRRSGSTACSIAAAAMARNSATGSCDRAVPMILVGKPDGRFADIKAVLAEAKAKPGTVSIGHAGNGTTNHIAILRLEVNEGVKFNIIPYKGPVVATLSLQDANELYEVRGALESLACAGFARKTVASWCAATPKPRPWRRPCETKACPASSCPSANRSCSRLRRRTFC